MTVINRRIITGTLGVGDQEGLRRNGFAFIGHVLHGLLNKLLLMCTLSRNKHILKEWSGLPVLKIPEK